MNVRVRLFSIYRERAGRSEAALSLPAGARLADAIDALERGYPRLGLEAARAAVLFSVNRTYADPSVLLSDGDEVAVFPPVSGGADGAPDPQRGLLLLSGGFDSPVAGHFMLRAGKSVDAVHFTMEPFTDDASARKAQELARLLGLPRLTIVPLGEELAEFPRRCDHRFYFVLLKRLMVRVAQSIAGGSGASFLVTGENLGQVSSQTLPNLGVIDAASGLPVLRPLLGWDKEEILAVAKQIGTYETSKGPELCDLLGPKHPRTKTTLAEVLREEAKVDVAGLMANALRKATALDPRLSRVELVDGRAC